MLRGDMNFKKEVVPMEKTEKQEEITRLWFEMWLQKEDLGIRDIFAPDAVYVESWGPEYHGVEKIAH